VCHCPEDFSDKLCHLLILFFNLYLTISQTASANETKLQISSDILPLYQVVENSNKLDHPLRSLIGYKKESLRSLAKQPGNYITRPLNIWTKDDEIIASVLITYTGGDEGAEKIRSVGVNPHPPITDGTTSITSASVALSLLPEIVKLSCVKSVSISPKYELCLDRSYNESRVNLVSSFPYSESYKSYDGEGVIVGIIDTGIDVNHEDFKDENGKSRILYIWDQIDGSGYHPHPYTYGSEWTKNDIDSGRCNQRDGNGHGTHVAGISAGDGSSSNYKYIGMAPKADLIIVKAFNDKGKLGTVSSILDGLKYIESKAKYLGKKFVINLSLGWHFGAHDGTDPTEKAIDFMVYNGGQVVVAAGNEGNDRIHAGGKVSTNNTGTRTFNIPAYNPWPNNDDFVFSDMWYKGFDTMTVTVTSPGGISYSRSTGEYGGIVIRNEGVIWIENSPGGVDPNNLDHRCIILLRDYLWQGQIHNPAPGIWNIAVTGNNITYGDYDIWIAGSDLGGQKASFTEESFSRSKLISMPGTARDAITVGAYCTKGSWTDSGGNLRSYSSYPGIGNIAPFSSVGPTRDGRWKPEITAPGFGVASALSADSSPPSTWVVEDGKHRIMQGTSMSAPHVAGVVALMLQAMPDLSYQKYKDILKDLARRDDFTGVVPDFNTWGYGKLNAYFLGGVHGKVTKKDGITPISNAWVKALQNEEVKETTHTSEEGIYKLLHLSSGTYDMKVEAYGYETGEKGNVEVKIGHVTPGIDFSLKGIDTTPPTTPTVIDDGKYTTSTTQLHALWFSTDPETGIAEYQYAIGTTTGGTNTVDWKSCGLATETIEANLSLTEGVTYYFSVKAKNRAGIWSEAGYSDGITIDTIGPILVNPQAIPAISSPGT
jgi:subtilisin family serine protease